MSCPPECCGATVAAPPIFRWGARVEVVRGRETVRLARLLTAPFADRLVRKFDLPVTGWRGSSDRRNSGGDAGPRAADGTGGGAGPRAADGTGGGAGPRAADGTGED